MKWISIFLLLLCHSRYKFFFHQRNQHKSDETTFIKWNFFLSHSTWAAIIVIIFIFCAFFRRWFSTIFFVCSDFCFFYSLFFTFIRSFSPHNNDEKRAECVTWRMHLNWDIIVPHLKGISWFRYYYCCSANKYKYRKKVCVCIVKNKWL